MTKEKNLEKHIQKQMGCMTGFLQIFDRHHILTGKRLHAARRLPPLSPLVDTTSESAKSVPPSPAASSDLGKQTPPPELPPKSPLPLPIFELKDGARSSWKFGKEAPRLSLDSRATTDAKGGLHPKEIRTAASILSGDIAAADATDGSQQHRSPSVIARLMGLDQLPNSTDSQPENQPELRRSASESRVSKDLFQSRLMSDCTSLYPKPPAQSHSPHLNNATISPHYTDPRKQSFKKGVNADVSAGLSRGGPNSMSPWRAPQPRKSFFDFGDVFPEPKQNISIYGEIEKRLRMRGIDEPSKDLETLKQILEALQLKGLLHSKPPPPPQQQNQVHHRNFVYDESSIVLMKPTRSLPSKPTNRSFGTDYSQSNGRKQVRRNYSLTGETSPSPSPRRERNVRSPTRSGRSGSPISRSVEGNVNASRSNSPAKSKQSLTQMRVNESAENRRSAPVRSPKINGNGPDRSYRFKKPSVVINQKEKIVTVVATEDDYSSVSESTVATSTDTEGKSLLERCDKLLHSIAEFAATDMQPSPVSVLDSSFYKDESLTPSPVTTKRNIDFKDQYGEWEEEIWSPIVSPVRSKCLDDDCDFVYVSDILRASHYLPEESDVFLLLEKQQHIKGSDSSKVSRLKRKLIFDTISEILDREAWLPPWKVVAHHDSAIALDKVWSEFQRIRECDTAEDLFETICRVLKKDLAGDAATGWGDCPVEVSEVVLDIERLVFKDMVSEIIGDLSPPSSSSMMLRRKLVF
ncbi:protein LONGIFOLIA 1-like [Salvia miltiorrhiza]|uniref:protein LONGIFOLIA 1-like n=1 Tax=Salvia miltiorrhiza TaxID=226208 RepID=UPI0025AC2D9F|nr:protein LONGIFOLIA 1-like [Salvia miltiorrhiza]